LRIALPSIGRPVAPVNGGCDFLLRRVGRRSKAIFNLGDSASRRMNAGWNCAMEHRRSGSKTGSVGSGEVMETKFPSYWMWSEAFEMLARAEQMQRQFFPPSGSRSPVTWEPPVDILETERAVLVLVALPGVDFDKVEASINQGELSISGCRTYPEEMRTAIIHRLELPQGRFERRVRLPAGRYSAIHRSASNGHLLITLQKSEASNG
jgi:HSP20 family protein